MPTRKRENPGRGVGTPAPLRDGGGGGGDQDAAAPGGWGGLHFAEFAPTGTKPVIVVAVALDENLRIVGFDIDPAAGASAQAAALAAYRLGGNSFILRSVGAVAGKDGPAK
jgi:hypothetical protein